CTLVAIAGITVCFGILDVVNRAETGAEVTEDQWYGLLGMADLQVAVLGGLCLLTGIFFMMWQYGTVRFAREVAPEENPTGPGWATWSFIVPIAFLFVPVRATYAAYTSCHRLDHEVRTGQQGPSTGGI